MSVGIIATDLAAGTVKVLSDAASDLGFLYGRATQSEPVEPLTAEQQSRIERLIQRIEIEQARLDGYARGVRMIESASRT